VHDSRAPRLLPSKNSHQRLINRSAVRVVTARLAQMLAARRMAKV
jgi:hypothetical protein